MVGIIGRIFTPFHIFLGVALLLPYVCMLLMNIRAIPKKIPVHLLYLVQGAVSVAFFIQKMSHDFMLSLLPQKGYIGSILNGEIGLFENFDIKTWQIFLTDFEFIFPIAVILTGVRIVVIKKKSVAQIVLLIISCMLMALGFLFPALTGALELLCRYIMVLVLYSCAAEYPIKKSWPLWVFMMVGIVFKYVVVV